jgi:hypothetical protein
MDDKKILPDAIYNFGLPNVENVKFTCVFCGGPAISALELYDEVVCDSCYAKDPNLRKEIDAQYRFSKDGESWLEIARLLDSNRDEENGKYCDGQCEKCGKSWGDES